LKPADVIPMTEPVLGPSNVLDHGLAHRDLPFEARISVGQERRAAYRWLQRRALF